MSAAIPTNGQAVDEGPYRWTEEGSILSEWGAPPPPPTYPFQEEEVRWLEMAGADGRLRVTDHGTKSPGDYIIFAEWPAPAGSGSPTYWAKITYQVFFSALLELTMGSTAWLLI